MGALDGLKILDFSSLLPGPFASLMLADQGAEVLKISSPSRPDLVAEYPPFVEGSGTSANQAWLGRNKKTMFLNLKTTEGVEIVKKLVREYDIVLEQFRPGVMDKLGLGYEALKKENPRLIYCALTGYGQSGPLAKRAGHDINYLSRSGNMSFSGRREIGPVLTNMQIADVAVGSLHSVVGILAAVYYREKTGEGQFVDVSMYDGLIPFNAMDGTAFLATGVEPKREGERLNGGCLYDFYETKDGEYLSVGALEPQFWRNFCLCIKRPDLIDKTVFPEDVEPIKNQVRQILKSKTRQEWEEIFRGEDVCVEPVLSLQEALLDDPHCRAREMVVSVPLPLSPEQTVLQLGSPMKLSACPTQYRHAGYPLGHHTGEVLRSLGYSSREMTDLEARGVLD